MIPGEGSQLIGGTTPHANLWQRRERSQEDNTGYSWGESTRAVIGGYSNDLLQRAASDQMVTMVTMPPTQKLGLMVSRFCLAVHIVLNSINGCLLNVGILCCF